MADRTDIDALLISALYGELTPADDARLTAHLESHPADRTALADLTRTRAAVRDTGFLAVQVEPPQSVSARLLQEAGLLSRRPARGTAEHARPTEGWFFRFTRTFMAHPAMAVAAMLVLVVGVAGTLYVRHGDRVADMAAPVAATDRERALQISQDKPSAESQPKDVSVTSVGSATGSSGYRVALDEVRAEQAAEGQKPAQHDPAASARSEPIALGDGTRAQVPPEPVRPAAPPPRKLAKRAGPSGIELRSPELQPKDVDDDDGQDVQSARNDEKKAAVDRFAARNDRSNPVPNAAIATPPAAPSNKPPAATPARAAVPDQIVAADNGKTPPSSAKTVTRGATAQVAPPPGDAAPSDRQNRAQGGALPRGDDPVVDTGTKSPDENASDKALVAWVRKQHDLVVSLVKSSNCRAAASAAIEIYSRAPGYYDANVTNDRSVRPCLAYLNSERERAERKVAAKRAMSVDTPAAAPAAPPPAASTPAQKK
jgi:hypothetical protein